eukprot:359446-Chlamydomonas_euryale.AAC.12
MRERSPARAGAVWRRGGAGLKQKEGGWGVGLKRPRRSKRGACQASRSRPPPQLVTPHTLHLTPHPSHQHAQVHSGLSCRTQNSRHAALEKKCKPDPRSEPSEPAAPGSRPSSGRSLAQDLDTSGVAGPPPLRAHSQAAHALFVSVRRRRARPAACVPCTVGGTATGGSVAQ